MGSLKSEAVMEYLCILVLPGAAMILGMALFLFGPILVL